MRNFYSSLNLCEYGTVEGNRINTMKTTFYFNFAAKQLNSIDTHNDISQEKLLFDYFDYL